MRQTSSNRRSSHQVPLWTQAQVKIKSPGLMNLYFSWSEFGLMGPDLPWGNMLVVVVVDADINVTTDPRLPFKANHHMETHCILFLLSLTFLTPEHLSLKSHQNNRPSIADDSSHDLQRILIFLFFSKKNWTKGNSRPTLLLLFEIFKLHYDPFIQSHLKTALYNL